jgi:hypothetical protein
VQVAVATQRRRWARTLTGPVVVLAGAVGALGFVSAIDPNQPGHYPTCPFLLLTGYYCPGCGGLRMAHAVTHGHFVEAADLNLFGLLAFPFVGYLWIRWVIWSVRGSVPDHVLSRPVIWALPIVIAIFWVARNTTMGQVLAP